MHLEDPLTALEVGRVHADLPVEATGAQQRGVEDVGTVGRRDHDDVRVRVEAVHLDEHLVQRLLALVVAAAETRTAVPADGVDLVDEDDRGRVLLRLREQVAHARGADTDEHLDEVGSGDRVEGSARLAGDRTREQRLTGSGRAVQQHALRDARADRLELARVLQELLDLVELLDRLVGARHVGERDGRILLVHELRPRLAELHDLAVAALGAREEPPEQQAEQQHRDEDGEEAVEPAGLRHGVVVAVLRGGGVIDRLHHVGGARLDVVELHRLRALVRLGQGHVHALVAVGVDNLGDRAALEQIQALLSGDLRRGSEVRDQHESADQKQTDQPT